MADAIARLDPAEDERTQVCVMLLRLAADEGSGDWHSDVADTIRSLASLPAGSVMPANSCSPSPARITAIMPPWT